MQMIIIIKIILSSVERTTVRQKPARHFTPLPTVPPLILNGIGGAMALGPSHRYSLYDA